MDMYGTINLTVFHIKGASAAPNTAAWKLDGSIQAPYPSSMVQES